MPLPEATNWRGRWWLPRGPDETEEPVSGVLSFGDRFQLELDSSIEGPVPGLGSYSFERLEYPLMWGLVPDVGQVTLVDSYGSGFRYGDTNQWLQVTGVISGAWLSQGELTFDQLQISTDYLWDWAHPAPVATSFGKDGFPFGLGSEVLIEAQVGESTVRLTTIYSGELTDLRLEVETNPYWIIDLSPAHSLRECIANWGARLRDMTAFLTAQPDRITLVAARPTGFDRRLDVYVPLLTDRLPPRRGRRLIDIDQILLRGHFDDAALVGAWFRWSAEHPNVLTRLHAVDMAPFIFAEHRIASIVQVAEALHLALYNHKMIPSAEHRARVGESVKDLPEQLKQWAEPILMRSNGLPFWLRMTELLNRAVEFGLPRGPADAERFGREIAEIRHPEAHGGMAASTDAETQNLRVQGLAWVIRTVLLGTLGVPNDVISARLLNNQDFEWMANHLGWASASAADA